MDKETKTKDKVFYSKSLGKMKCISRILDSVFYCDQIPSCSNPINTNYLLVIIFFILKTSTKKENMIRNE